MNILEEFWYGNIEPAKYDTSSGKEYKELLQLISRNEDKLLATMTEEQKELFTKYGVTPHTIRNLQYERKKDRAAATQPRP